MRVEVRLRLGERSLAVTVAGDDVTVDGMARDVRRLGGRAARTGEGPDGVALEVAVDGRARRAYVVRSGDRLLVSVDGRSVIFSLGEPARRGPSGGGAAVVVAPMPGTVIRLLVAEGDAVAPGQPLVVLEAMKMETTLRAEVGGTVAAVHAATGAMVEGGSVLVEIAPAGAAAE